VLTIGDSDAELLRFLDGLGLRPGAKVVVKEVVAYRGGVRVEIAGAEHIVGPGAAEAVSVDAA
jgi:Fe2+ transport system protein FeoA